MYKLLKVFACAAILGISQQANAAGFGLLEQSASGLGTAYSGTAASAEDATTVWTNPAGMTKLCYEQFSSVVSAIFPSSDFHDDGSTLAPGLGGAPLTGNDGRNCGTYAIIASTFYVRPLGCGFAAGLGINTPFGLATSYAHDWKGRYYARHSKLMSINIQPSIAYQICDNLSIGVGFDALYFRAKLTSDVDFGSVLFAATNQVLGVPQGQDGKSKVRGDSWGIGGNIGILWDINCCTSVGLHYRTEVKEVLRGHVSYSNVPGLLAETFQNCRIKAKAVLPANLTLSAVHHLNCCWDVMADVSWTKWDSIQELRVIFDSSQPDAVQTLKWENSMRYALGTTYQYWDCLKLRFGVAYDEGPTPNEYYRIAGLPETNRFWVAFGFGYDWNCLHFDVGYAHLFVKNAKIDKSTALNPGQEDFFKGHLVGDYKAKVDVLAVQVNYNF